MISNVCIGLWSGFGTHRVMSLNHLAEHRPLFHALRKQQLPKKGCGALCSENLRTYLPIKAGSSEETWNSR